MKQVLFTLILLSFLFTAVKAQTGQPELKRLYCTDEKSDFAVQAPDTAELKMIYQAHMKFSHDKHYSSAEVISLMNSQSVINIRPELKSIRCPKNDGFTIYSSDEKELTFWLGSHIIIEHNENMTDDELKKLIK